MITTWTGRRVLVTGASSGIGAATARELAAAGAVVAMCARRRDLLDDVLTDCRRSVAQCKAWTIDLTELDGLEQFVGEVESELGGIDVLVNNAGGATGDRALATRWSDVEYITTLNYLSPVLLTRIAVPKMLERGSGQVLTVSSMAARTSTPGEAAYAAAKSALSTYMEALAAELLDSGVTFHLVYPGLIELTPGVDGDDTIADTSTGADRIPAPVLARAMRHQLETGDFELYMPHSMRAFSQHRARDVAASVKFMAGLYQSGQLH
jgi:short-subunit dehydrogenase